MEINNALKRIFLFKNADYDDINTEYHISKKCKTEAYSPGEIIMTLGKVPGLPVILSGKAEIRSHSGDNAAVLRYLEEGDTFGAASLFITESSDSSVVVSSDESQILYIPKDTLEYLFSTVPQTAMNYISFLSERCSFLNRKISAFSQMSAESKLSSYLLTVSEDKEYAEISEGYKSLSKNLGMSRASLYRAIDTLTDGDIIIRESNMIFIKDKQKLKQIVIGE